MTSPESHAPTQFSSATTKVNTLLNSRARRKHEEKVGSATEDTVREAVDSWTLCNNQRQNIFLKLPRKAKRMMKGRVAPGQCNTEERTVRDAVASPRANAIDCANPKSSSQAPAQGEMHDEKVVHVAPRQCNTKDTMRDAVDESKSQRNQQNSKTLPQAPAQGETQDEKVASLRGSAIRRTQCPRLWTSPGSQEPAPKTGITVKRVRRPVPSVTMVRTNTEDTVRR